MTYDRNIQAYRETDLQTMSKEKLIVLLYRKMVEHLEIAASVARTDRPEMARRLGLTQRIVTELRASLDHSVGGEIADNLDRLYDFLFDRILSMQVDRDPAHVRECLRVLEPLLDAWSQVPTGAAEQALRGETTAGTDPARGEAEPRPGVAAGCNGPEPAEQRISFSA
jgi:flagellar protein FliS